MVYSEHHQLWVLLVPISAASLNVAVVNRLSDRPFDPHGHGTKRHIELTFSIMCVGLVLINVVVATKPQRSTERLLSSRYQGKSDLAWRRPISPSPFAT